MPRHTHVMSIIKKSLLWCIITYCMKATGPWTFLACLKSTADMLQRRIFSLSGTDVAWCKPTYPKEADDLLLTYRRGPRRLPSSLLRELCWRACWSGCLLRTCCTRRPSNRTPGRHRWVPSSLPDSLSCSRTWRELQGTSVAVSRARSLSATLRV